MAYTMKLALWLLHTFMKHRAAATLNAHITLWPKSHRRQKEGTVASFCKTFNNLLKTYATGDLIAETDVAMMPFTQPSNKSPTKYDEAPCNVVLRCNQVYDEYVLKSKIIEGLSESIHQSMRSYWGSKDNAAVHDLASHAMSLTKLQRGLAVRTRRIITTVWITTEEIVDARAVT